MSYTLEKWIKPSNSICLNVTFLHSILCLIYYIWGGGLEDRSQDVACFCIAWIKLGSVAHEHWDVLQTLVQLVLKLMLWFQVVPVWVLLRAPHGRRTDSIPGTLEVQPGKEGRKMGAELMRSEGTPKGFKNKQMPSLEVAGLLYGGKKQCLSLDLRQDQRHWYQRQHFSFIEGRTQVPAFAISLPMWAAHNTRPIEDEAWRV